jgi:hypothetical protein
MTSDPRVASNARNPGSQPIPCRDSYFLLNPAGRVSTQESCAGVVAGRAGFGAERSVASADGHPSDNLFQIIQPTDCFLGKPEILERFLHGASE